MQGDSYWNAYRLAKRRRVNAIAPHRFDSVTWKSRKLYGVGALGHGTLSTRSDSDGDDETSRARRNGEVASGTAAQNIVGFGRPSVLHWVCMMPA